MSDNTDIKDSIEETLGEGEWEEVVEAQSEVFVFENAGDTLIGVLKDIKSDVGENNSKLYKIEKSDGSLVAIWGSSVLDSKMSEIEIGQELRIVYGGKKKSANGNRQYKDFSLFSKPVAFEEV